MKSIRQFLGDEGYNARLEQARKRAALELGDPDWANIIVGAFLHHEADAALMADEEADAALRPPHLTVTSAADLADRHASREGHPFR